MTDNPIDRTHAEVLAARLKALADPARLQLISLIAAAGEICACDLTEPVGLSQPTVSHHLKVLTKAELLERVQRGKWAFFSVRKDALDEIADALRPTVVAG